MMLNISNALFQLLVIPILIHYATPINMGIYFIAISYGVLASILINYGTSQTSVIELRRAKSKHQLMEICIETIALRSPPFLISIIITLYLAFFKSNGIYYLAIIPMLITELINPQFYLIANYKINRYSFLNVIIKVSVLAIIFFYKTHDHIVFIALFFTGIGNFLLNVFYFKPVFYSPKFHKYWPKLNRLIKLFKINGLIVGNGITVHLQQSLFLFALPTFANPIFLSAYGLIDKLISSCRMIVNAYSTAVMPKATGEHLQGNQQWRNLKRRQNVILSIACIIAGFILFFYPKLVLTILLFGKATIEFNFMLEAVRLLKLISLVPLLIALNVLNVTELILEKKFTSYFVAGLIVLFFASLFILFIYFGLPRYTLGYYPIFIEGACLVIYFLIIQNNRSNA